MKYNTSQSFHKHFTIDVIEYHNIESTIIYTRKDNSCLEEVEDAEVQEQKEVIYHNENSDWYIINDNYKDLETIEEEEIDITQYEFEKDLREEEVESYDFNKNVDYDEFI